MSSLSQSIHAPKAPLSRSNGSTGNMHFEFATTDEDLKSRLSASTWLNGRTWSMPLWLQSVAEIQGDPNLIPEARLDDLRGGRLPYGRLPYGPDERRFVRNRAVIKQITAELSRSEVSMDGKNNQPLAKDTAASFSHAAKSVSTRPETLKPTAPAFAPGAHQPRFNTAKPEPANKAHVNVLSKTRASESEAEQAEELKRTVLAPFYQRMQADSDEIVRLRQEKVVLTADIEKHRGELSRLQQGMEQQDGLIRDKSDDDAADMEARGRKRKRTVSRPSFMQLGDVTNGNNEYTTEGHLNHLANEISKDLDEPVPNETIQLCGLAPLRIMQQRPDVVLELAHQKLHTWPYQHVPTCWRRMYEDASLSKAVQILRERAEEISGDEKKRRRVDENVPPAVQARNEVFEDKKWLEAIVKTLDMGITLSGTPGRSRTFEALFQQLDNHVEDETFEDIPRRFDIARPRPLESKYPIARSKLPQSFEAFQRHLDESTTPLIIPDTLSQWPASQRWHDPTYLLRLTLGGRRLVPVEIGKSYTDEAWSQTIMSFKDFITTYLLPKEPKEVGYLAQHDLFSQIPALKSDILIPDYCYTSPPNPSTFVLQTAGLASAPQLDEPLLNAWLGPKRTKTPLHTDPYHNILCQVVGYKYIRLYPPSETPKLYPRGIDASNGVSMENTSQVDVSHSRSRSLGGSTDLDALREVRAKFPLFGEAEFVEGVLGPGECLHVPLGWWHYVESLSSSFSVSFWWN